MKPHSNQTQQPAQRIPIYNAPLAAMGSGDSGPQSPKEPASMQQPPALSLPLSRAVCIAYATCVDKPGSPSLTLYPTSFSATARTPAPAGPPA